MHTIKEKLKQIYIPFNTGTFALFISLLALGYVASATNTPCISAQSTCAIGSTNEFTGNISLKGGTTYNATLDASNITADRNIELPDADGELMIGGGLSASKVVATDVSGDLTTTDIYPLSLSASKSLSTDGSGNVETNDIYPLSLTASKSLSTDGSGNVETNDIYPLSLTASTPLKTNGTGEVTASDLDITTDITPGSALQEIRVNAGGTALEYFTPSSGGGRWTLVGEGTAVNDNAYGTGTAIVCWYDNTQGTGIGGSVDQTKTYKLELVPTNDPWYNPSLPASVFPSANWKVDSSCNTGSLSAFGGSNSAGGQGYMTRGWHVAGGSNYEYYAQRFPYQQGTSTNNSTSSSQCGFSSFEIIFRNGVPITSSNTNNEGIKFNYESSAQCYQGSVPHAGQWQTGGGLAIMNSGDTSGENFDDVTGMYFVHYGDGTNLPKWYLYESDH